jgi:hypothetical protein
VLTSKKDKTKIICIIELYCKKVIISFKKVKKIISK